MDEHAGTVRRTALLLRDVRLPIDQHAATAITLDVHAGQLVVVHAPEIVCHSLIRVCRGDEHPVEGAVTVLGRDFSTFDDDELQRLRRRHLAVVSALPHMDDTLDVHGNLSLALRLRGFGRREAAAAMAAMVAGLPIENRLDLRISALTLTETRWVTLVRGLLLRPQILLVEPGALDISTELAESAGAFLREAVTGIDTAALWATTSLRAACTGQRMFLYSSGYLYDADDKTETKPYRLSP